MTAEMVTAPVPIKQIPRERRQSLPVSVTVGAHGKRRVESSYGDDVWDFWPYIPMPSIGPSSKRINWKIALPDGSSLLDHCNSDLLESAKALAYSMWTDPPEGLAGMKAISIVKIVCKSLVPLLRWMVLRKHRAFRDIDDCLGYVAYARALPTRTGKPRKATVAFRLRVLEYLYWQSENLEDGLKDHPWRGASYNTLADLRKKDRLKPKTAYIPDDAARILVREAIKYVDERSHGILRALEAVETARRGALDRGDCWDRARHIASGVAKKHGFKGSRELFSQVIFLRTACFVVVLFFTGTRISEGLSLDEDCIASETCEDGQDLTWIRGTLYKSETDPNGRSVRWLVPPAVSRAVRVMRDLTRPQRSSLQRELEDFDGQASREAIGNDQEANSGRRAAELRTWVGKLFVASERSRGEGVVSQYVMNFYIKRFAASLDLQDETGRPLRIHAHQFRRTFARFVARNRLGDIHYLRHHFYHATLGMTAYYADGAMDHEQLDEVETERQEVVESIVSGWLAEDTPLAGGAGRRIEEYRSASAISRCVEGANRRWINDVDLRGTGQSWCVMIASEGCHGNCLLEQVDCVDCVKAVIDKSHLDVWRSIASRHEAALRCSDLGEPAKRRSELFLARARDVIARLESREATV